MIRTIVPVVLTGLVTVATAMAQPSPWKGVDELFERRSELRVGPLQVRLLQLDELNWELGVRLNGRKVHSVGNLNIPERADFGLFPLLHDSNPQLIVHAETGGSTPYAICWIYTTDPQPRLVYSSEWYWRGHPCGDLEVRDIDGDGTYEIRHIVARWKGYDDLAYCNACGCSPCPEAIFRYDPMKRRYRPANWEFPENLKLRIQEHLRYLHGIDPKEDKIGHYYRGGWLNVAFEYFYAGHDEDAWDFIKKELGPGWQDERPLILKCIEKERFYREIHEMERNDGKRSLSLPGH